jgi:hypothetical protein
VAGFESNTSLMAGFSFGENTDNKPIPILTVFGQFGKIVLSHWIGECHEEDRRLLPDQ